MANPMAFKAIAGFEVQQVDDFPVHKPIGAVMSVEELTVHTKTFGKTTSAAAKFEERLMKING